MKKLLYFFSLILLIAADQIVKALTVLYIDPKNPIVLWKGVFELDYVQNRGGLFGMFQGAVFILAAVTVVLIVFIFYFSKKLPDTKRMVPLRLIGLFIVVFRCKREKWHIHTCTTSCKHIFCKSPMKSNRLA